MHICGKIAKLAKIGQHFAFSLLRSTPTWKSTPPPVVTNISYDQDQVLPSPPAELAPFWSKWHQSDRESSRVKQIFIQLKCFFNPRLLCLLPNSSKNMMLPGFSTWSTSPTTPAPPPWALLQMKLIRWQKNDLQVVSWNRFVWPGLVVVNPRQAQKLKLLSQLENT